MAKRTKESTSADASSSASTAWRTVASFLIFVHLFVVASAILFTATDAPIWRQIVNGVPGIRQYAQALDMNRPYTYHLSWNRPIDADHVIEVDVTDPATQQVVTRRFPDDQTWLGIRRRRYHRLAYQLAYDTELAAADDITATQASLVPQAVGGFTMTQSDTQSARIRCVAHLPLTGDQVSGNGGAPLEPLDATTYRTVYDAHVSHDTSGVLVLPITTETNTAPGVR